MHDNEDCCPTGDGGNSTLTNQNEQTILDRAPMIPARTEGGQDSQFHPAKGSY